MTVSRTSRANATFRFAEVLDQDLIGLFSEPGPYYTSYPTLSQWTQACGREEFARAIAAPGGVRASTTLYVHFPFCPRLCYYCICNATISTDRERIRGYLQLLLRNLDLLFAGLDRSGLIETIQSVHIGGGSPSFMEPQEFLALANKIKSVVGRDRIEEFAVEVDPRTADEEKFDAYHEAGVNRLSFGIQDFDPAVQEAINRVHSFEDVQALLTPDLRHRFPSINFDILYGLPLQTRESFRRTIEQVIQLAPERVALLKYAHVPEQRKHQRILDAYARPLGDELAWLFFEALDALVEAGWEHIGIDNFAKHGDKLAIAKRRGTLGRTFNGFAPDRKNNIIGVGPTSTFQLDGHYFQNVYGLDEYMQDIASGQFPVLRGYRLSPEDRLRRHVIESLMCSGVVCYEETRDAYGIDFCTHFRRELEAMDTLVRKGVVEMRTEGLYVTQVGKGFLRNLCKVFDLYLPDNRAYKISGP
ncbi:MAG: oxygen-independent coproporphyrinogen III oxidase [Phycisphaerales bacterium]